MGQHGFARDNEFECIENTENKTVHRLVSTEETKKVYPFDFAFTVTQELSGRTLTITWKVENTGDDDMYFSVGGHPAFMIPEQYDIVFNKGLENHTETELEYVLIDPETSRRRCRTSEKTETSGRQNPVHQNPFRRGRPDLRQHPGRARRRRS